MFKLENTYLLESEIKLEEAQLILLQNTLIQNNLYLNTTDRSFIGKVNNISFSIIGTFFPIGVLCVFNGKFIQKDKLEIEITTSLHKAFRLMFKIWLLVLAGVILFFSISNFSFTLLAFSLIALIIGATLFRIILYFAYVLARNKTLHKLKSLLKVV